jgi:hypothetical protein
MKLLLEHIVKYKNRINYQQLKFSSLTGRSRVQKSIFVHVTFVLLNITWTQSVAITTPRPMSRLVSDFRNDHLCVSVLVDLFIAGTLALIVWINESANLNLSPDD